MKVAVEYVRLCGYKNGENQWGCQVGTPKLSLAEIAKQLGTSKRELQRALSIERNLTEPMKELLGRRNLFPIQRIAVTEKYRPIYEKQAKEKQSDAGKEYGNGKNSSSPNGEKLNVHTDKELAQTAGVSTCMLV